MNNGIAELAVGFMLSRAMRIALRNSVYGVESTLEYVKVRPYFDISERFMACSRHEPANLQTDIILNIGLHMIIDKDVETIVMCRLELPEPLAPFAA